MSKSSLFRILTILTLLSLVAAAFPPQGAVQARRAAPTVVSLPGTHQSELGCSGDWQPECDKTFLTYDTEDDVWQATFEIQPGNDQDAKGPRYKAAIDKSWSVNYGQNAKKDGPDIPLVVTEATQVKFYFDDKTHWITDNFNTPIAVAVGNFQKALGCANDNDPGCLRSWLQDPDGDGLYTVVVPLAAGDYEVQVAMQESLDLTYGADGAENGAAIPFTVPAGSTATTLTYDSTTHLLTVTDGGVVLTSTPPAAAGPAMVVVPGTIQSKLGCSGDWQPDCEKTKLPLDKASGYYLATFNLPAGSYEYKVALNGGWTENYGQNAKSGGSNIPLVLAADTAVTFIYDHGTHWIADSVNFPLAALVGDFQSELGCTADNQSDCMAGWLQDPTGSGLYTFSTAKLPAGTYQAQVTINRNPAETYGADGALGGSAISFTVPKDKQEAYFSYDANTHVLTINTEGKPKGDLGKAMGYWLQSDTLAWKVKPAEGDTFRLYYAADGGLQLAPGTVNNGQPITLTYSTEGLDAATLAKFPHLKGYSAFKLEAADAAKAGELLKGQVALVAFDKDGKISDATSLQIAGVLDDLYTYTGELGISYAGDTPTLRVWAPTAKNVTLHLFADAKAAAEQTFPMTVDPATGVWSLTGEASWTNQYYLYEVQVFVPRTGKVEKNLVTDPYSISLSMNSLRSQIVNLADSMLKPQDWDAYLKPALAAPEDTVIYELHIRDFSIQDETVPAGERGTYLAFTELSSDGMQHLQALAKAGLTHIHLLPAFDIASIDEDKSTWQTVDEAKLAGMPANSDEQQAAVGAIRDSDGFNWGYDPFHYTTPEGSYSTDPNGATRIVQFRQMVQALNQSGLRVVMDVVYNHTNASGQSEKSVLDKVVPGYYHRLNSEGTVETSTCCQNTATENAMMEKLMVDSVVTWAKYYKVDGFRFDLMGHHMVSNMVAVRQALDALTLAKDGVDGKSIILYGEGWDFGEVAKNARGLNAIQLNLGGTGIATFNDRLRDATRGGGPFNNVQEQGFITGLFDAPNDYDQGSAATMEQKLLKYEDWIRIGLAGNLKDYELVNYQGLTVSGAEIDYNGNPAGYTLDPQENILYISAHDNETLFDAIQYKAAADVSIEERVRMNNLGVSLVLLAQGMPFFHAGDDLLRSKSLDGNTYNSGDWFNKLDFTYQTNNWGVGLPNFGRDRLELMGKLLGNPDLMAKPTDIQFAAAFFQEMLQIRKSSPLFRLQTAEEVNARLSFLDTGDTNIPGLIVMVLDDMAGQNLDPNYAKIVVVFNAQAEPVQFSDVALMGLPLQLHPLQAASVDAQIKTAAVDAAGGILTVPGRAAVVFVLPEGAELVATATPAPTAAPTAVLTEAPTTAPTKAPTKAPALATATTAPQPTATTEAPTGLCGSLLGAVVLVLFGLGLKLWPKHG